MSQMKTWGLKVWCQRGENAVGGSFASLAGSCQRDFGKGGGSKQPFGTFTSLSPHEFAAH